MSTLCAIDYRVDPYIRLVFFDCICCDVFLRLQLREDCFCVVAVCYVLLLVTLLLEQLFSLNAIGVRCSVFKLQCAFFISL